MSLFYLTLIALIVCAKTQTTQYYWYVLPFADPRNYSRIEPMYTASPADVQPYFHGDAKVFLTVPKVRTNLPYTLVEVVGTDDNSFLKAYPNFEMHHKRGGNCDVITSAVRMEITECNQMWVIDSGMEQTNFKCPPQLLLFDLRNDQLIHRYRFNDSLYEAGKSMFVTLSVNVKDPSDNCRNTMVYVADGIQHDLVVYDFKQNDAWRIKNRFMHLEPDYVNQCVAGERKNLWDVMFSMATDKKNIYFNPLATKTEYAVSLSELDNKDNNGKTLNHTQPLGELNGVCATSAIDSKGNLYCVTLKPIKLIVWNVNTPFDRKNIGTLPIKPDELEFVSGMKVVKNPKGSEVLWMLSNRYKESSYPDMDEINYRVAELPLKNLSPIYPK